MTTSTSETSGGCWSRYRLTVEPVMGIVYFASTLAASPLTNLMIMQACREMNMDVSTCTNNATADVAVHRTSSTITLWKIVIETLPGCIMSLFSSPWSETNGRKPVMVVSLAGVTLSQASLTYISTIKEINPYWYLVTAIPSSICGGSVLMLLSGYCYIIDITIPKERVLRLAIVNVFVQVICIIANVVTPILTKMGYLVVFGTSTALPFISLLYVIFFLPESIEVNPENKKPLLTTDHLVDSFHTFFRKRPNHVRSAVFALTACSVIGLLVGAGEPDCKYLALIKRFNWTLSDYSNFNAVCMGLILIGTLSGVFLLMDLLRLGETSSIFVLQISLVLSDFLTGISTTTLMFYVTTQIRMFYGCLGPLCKGYISTLVPSHDVAKVIAFGSMLEAFMPQVGALLYGYVYNLTVGIYPFAIFLLSSLLHLITLTWLTIGLTMLHYGLRSNQRVLEIDAEVGSINNDLLEEKNVPSVVPQKTEKSLQIR